MDISHFFKKHKHVLSLTAILLLGAFLRLHNFDDLARFNADQVRDAKIVDAMASGEKFPLLGPKAGGTKFNLGPAFYFMQYFSGKLFSFTPEGIAYFIPILGIASIGLLYLLLKNIFSANLALLLSFLYATSFYAIKYSRFAWNPNAIPFFMFALLLLLTAIISGRQKWHTHLLLGAVAGIGMQLHTTLLLLMPVLVIMSYVYVFFKSRALPIVGVSIATAAILALNFPFFYHDAVNQGENLREFLVGSRTKTEKSVSLGANIASDILFVLQGSAYTLSGAEPQQNWFDVKKLVRNEDKSEILLALASIPFVSAGLALLLFRLGSEKNETKRATLLCLSVATLLIFLLLVPIGNELNLRFFIVASFLPYLLLGLLAESLFRLSPKTLAIGILTLVSATLLITNLRAYASTYDLENYTARESAYGGISLGEAENIARFIAGTASSRDTEAYLDPFESSPSITYAGHKAGFEIFKYSKKKTAGNALVFFVVKKDNSAKLLERNDSDFDFVDSSTIGRFFVGAFAAKKIATCKIGFITDIHATRSKNSKFGIREQSYRPLKAFVDHMGLSYKPDVVVQGGDFIDGSDKDRAESELVFKMTNQIFSSIPAEKLHVLGNHDMRELTKDDWKKLSGKDNAYYDHDCKDTKIIVLDITEPASGTETDKSGSYYFISDRQLDWLDETLEKSSLPNSIIFIHVPLITRAEIGGVKPEKEIDGQDAGRLKDITRKYSVNAVFSGHVEALRHYEENDTGYFVLPGPVKNPSGGVAWPDAFYEITSGHTVDVKMFYKLPSDKTSSRTLAIPSAEFDSILK